MDSTDSTLMINTHSIREISKCFVKPLTLPSKDPVVHLAHWDLSVLSGKYIQTGLLFPKPTPSSLHDPQSTQVTMNTIVDTLKDSLSRVLVHFYPLAGTLATHKDDSPSYYIYIDCLNPQGAEFIHAVSDLTMDDIISPIDVPEILRSFFLYTEAVNHDGHTLPLLGVQVTELVDGYFVGCSLNHVVGDGTAFWYFFNSWAEIARSKGTTCSISQEPMLKRWFPEGYGPIINLPYTSPDEFIDRYEPKPFRERIFHFSPESMIRLESMANQDYDAKNITDFQALCALLWRCVSRARGVEAEEPTQCMYTMGDRAALEPPLPNYYVGNAVSSVMTTASVKDLLGNNIGWSASLFYEAMSQHTDEVVRKRAVDWIKAPKIHQLARIMDGRCVVIGLSRFDLYGQNDFGWGNPLATRRASAIKFDGRISAYQGREGGTSLDVVCCLAPEVMRALECDEEFMSFVSPPSTNRNVTSPRCRELREDTTYQQHQGPYHKYELVPLNKLKDDFSINICWPWSTDCVDKSSSKGGGRNAVCFRSWLGSNGMTSNSIWNWKQLKMVQVMKIALILVFGMLYVYNYAY